MDQSVEALAAIPVRMGQAWDRGDAAGFAADFAEDAEFVAFDGTLLSGHEAIVAFHQPLFDTVLKGTRLVENQTVLARIVQPGVGYVHNRLGVVMAGESEPLPSRNSMQLFVMQWRDDRWQVVVSQNSRIVTLERQLQLDTLES
ncbi:SgcJ/EcaC family oxidoreductase [Kineosporia babensis]|uniref:SgcJ/EcaC family oxidoreductase n=1 Tax=Kineosporia babensis TaxID=499548 RepID=A0A9X1NB59_9ACTN|nr:SgcJ/EcaC family oxidoreductase [Kineosporia babensis]MCD5311987.1 SgcJ/EcaC family oxidoreductase [Kineosporia babensis]